MEYPTALNLPAGRQGYEGLFIFTDVNINNKRPSRVTRSFLIFLGPALWSDSF